MRDSSASSSWGSIFDSHALRNVSAASVGFFSTPMPSRYASPRFTQPRMLLGFAGRALATASIETGGAHASSAHAFPVLVEKAEVRASLRHTLVAGLLVCRRGAGGAHGEAATLIAHQPLVVAAVCVAETATAGIRTRASADRPSPRSSRPRRDTPDACRPRRCADRTHPRAPSPPRASRPIISIYPCCAHASAEPFLHASSDNSTLRSECDSNVASRKHAVALPPSHAFS